MRQQDGHPQQSHIWRTTALTFLLVGCLWLAASETTLSGPVVPDVQLLSFAVSTDPLTVRDNETSQVSLEQDVALIGAVVPIAVTLRWEATTPPECTGSWTAIDEDVLLDPATLDMSVVLRPGETTTIDREFGLLCARTGEYEFQFLSEATPLEGEPDQSNNLLTATSVVQVQPRFVLGELLVVFEEGVSAESIEQKLSDRGTEVIDVFPSQEVLEAVPSARSVYWLRIDPALTVVESMGLFLEDPAVLFAEPNFLGEVDNHQTVANDTDFLNDRQWSLLNGGQSPVDAAGVGPGRGTIDADIDAPQGWDLTTDCRNTVVAVADTGIDIGHQDLFGEDANGNGLLDAGEDTGYDRVPGTGDAGEGNGVLDSNIWYNPMEIPGNGIDDDLNGIVDDVVGADFIGEDFNGNGALDPGEDANGNGVLDTVDGNPSDPPNWAQGHGTSVSGIIGAIGNNSLNIAGICWRARIMSIRMMPRDGTIPPLGAPVPPHQKGWTTAGFMQTVTYVTTQRGLGQNVKVVNLSGSMVHPAQTPQLAIALLDASDILLVVSAGNRAGYNVDDDEDIYRDVDGNGVVSAGDVRLTEVRVGGGGPPNLFQAGSIVAVGDADIARPLVAFAPNEKHMDLAGPGVFGPGEPIYRDVDGSATVTVGDIRLTPVDPFLDGSIVAAGAPNLGAGLVVFAGNEKHTQQGAPNGAFDYRGAFPCTYTNPNIICVGASDNEDKLAAFSSFGKDSVDLVAPGLYTRSLKLGGGTKWFHGTSASAPHVTGIAALCWSVPHLEDRTDTQMKDLILRFVDRQPQFSNLVASGGRLKWPCSFDLGDAPNSYETTSAEPLLDCNIPEIDGPVHLEYGNEWFGREASTEHNANTPPGRDQDPAPNINAMAAPGCPAGPLVNNDMFDDGGFVYAPAPPWAAGAVVTVTFTSCSHFIDNPVPGVQVRDQVGGRYKAADPDNRVYANVFLDMNGNGVFDLPAERPVLLPTNVITEFEQPLAVVGAAPNVPPPTKCKQIVRTFVVPAPGGTPLWVRWRLDYGENAGANNPVPPPAGLPKFLRDLRAPAAPVPSHKRILEFGEVEDYKFKPADPPGAEEDPSCAAPPAEQLLDAFNESKAQVEIEIINPPELAGKYNAQVSGRTCVFRDAVAGDADNDGLDDLRTEIVQMHLTGVISPGDIPVTIIESPFNASTGLVEDRPSQPADGNVECDVNPPAPCDSDFDVFVYVYVGSPPFLVMHNTEPLRMSAKINGLPPELGAEYQNENQPPLVDENKKVIGFLRAETHAPGEAKRRNLKLPPLQNLWLTRQGDKIPPVRCEDGLDVALISHRLSAPITDPDPKDPTQVQQLGAFEFEVHFDETKVCVNLTEGSAWTAAGAVCIIEDKDSAQLEGVARIGCVTAGKGHEIDETQPLASIQVRPQPEIYSQAKPNQDNGVVVQINNLNCDLSDEQGHSIPKLSCDDADITFRYLEGDVNPDCVVDAVDAQTIAFRWGVEKGSLIYNDFLNLEPSGAQADDDIDINDLQFVFGRIGSTCVDPHPPQLPVNPKA